jgi:hypothetical protein
MNSIYLKQLYSSFKGAFILVATNLLLIGSILIMTPVVVRGQIANLPPPPEDKQTVTPKDTTFWSNALKTGLNVTQANFSENWKAGGVNNFSVTGFFQGRADYVRQRHTLRFEADVQYGLIKNQAQGWRKSLDKIWLDSKYGYAIGKDWSLYASANFLSQFTYGYKYGMRVDSATFETKEVRTVTSNFFAPAYVTESVGFEYKPVDYFFIRFGTGTLRQTIVLDDSVTKYDSKNFGVPIGKNYRNEIAFQLLASYDRDIYKNVNLKARYIGFINYEKIAEPRNYDHRFEVTFLAKITKYISTSLSGILVYDQDADSKMQYSNQLGLGILYTVGDLK